MTATTIKPVEASEKPAESLLGLTMTDRCDATASGAEQAFTRFAKGLAALDLCCHHTDAFEADLIGNGWSMIIDDRHKVNRKPSISANAL